MTCSFVITEITKEHLPHYTYAAVDGSLLISIDEIILFKEPYILLIELAIAAYNWLKSIDNGGEQDFIYNSVAHEESLFSFVKAGNKLYRFCTPWATEQQYRLLTLDEITNGFSSYLRALQLVLKRAYSLSIPNN